MLRTRQQYYFDADKSYLIAGGLGGLGRSTGRWLADKGAKNIILLSRSGPTSKESIAFIAQLEARGFRIHAAACDITNFADLSAALSNLEESMPPVRGAIQAAMVLQVGHQNECLRVIILVNYCQFHMGFSAAKPPYRPRPNSSSYLYRSMILR